MEKVRGKKEPTLDKRVSTGKPFGLRTFFHGKPDAAGLTKPVKLFGSQKISWVERESITVNPQWIDKWKVLMTAVQGTSAAVETKFLSKPIIAEPGTACTETYLVAGHFDDETAAVRYAKCLRTRFVRFLVSLRKATQHATRDVYCDLANEGIVATTPNLAIDAVGAGDRCLDPEGEHEVSVAGPALEAARLLFPRRGGGRFARK